MVTGRSMQLTKQVGEYLVSAELCRLGFIATTFTGNVPEFDILAIDKEHKTKPVQVKAIRGGSWQFDAKKFLDISIRNGVQTINGKKVLSNPDLICIFVLVVSQGKDKFYAFKLKDLQDIIYKEHTTWLKKHGGRRPKNPDSTHVSVSPDDLTQYQDKWELLKQ